MKRWPRPTSCRCPRACWPPELKCRSRMHYYLADRQADARYPGSRALMLDVDGFVTETTTSNIVLFEKERGLVMPPRRKILPGITLSVRGRVGRRDRRRARGTRPSARRRGRCRRGLYHQHFAPACSVSCVSTAGRLASGTPGPIFARLHGRLERSGRHRRQAAGRAICGCASGSFSGRRSACRCRS